MGLFDKIGFNPGMNRQVMPTPAQVAPPPRETIGPPPATQRAAEQQAPQPGGMSQGLFNLYMSQLFKQKYAPQPMPGGVQNMGGFMGFAGPQMRPMQAPQQQPAGPMPGYNDPNSRNFFYDPNSISNRT